MATLLFNLTNVPDDEADDVRQLLQEAGLNTYETDTGRWKSGVAAIWLVNEHELDRARATLEAYQNERCLRMRQEYEVLRANGKAPALRDKIAANPVQFAASVIGVAVILGLMTLPFVGFLS